VLETSKDVFLDKRFAFEGFRQNSKSGKIKSNNTVF